MIDDFYLDIREKGVSDKTAKRYSKIIETILSNHGDVTLVSAKKSIVEQLDNNSPASANKYVLALKAWCKFTKQSWADELSQKKETPRPRRRPSIELARDIIFLPPLPSRDLRVHQKYSVCIELMFLTGMRQCEARTLKKENITEDQILIEKSKTGAGRRIATPPFPDVQNRLFSYLDSIDTRFAFPNEREDKPITDRAFRYEFRERLERLEASTDITPHSLRGAFLTRNLRKGANLFDIQDIVGHSSADTTKLYYRGDVETQKEVMKQDPANRQFLSPQDKLKMTLEDLQKSGLFDDPDFTYQISKTKIVIEIEGKKCTNEVDEKVLSEVRLAID